MPDRDRLAHELGLGLGGSRPALDARMRRSHPWRVIISWAGITVALIPCSSRPWAGA